MAVNESEQLLIQEIQEGIIRAEAGKISGASQCTGLSGVKFASYIARELSRAKSIRRTARLTEKAKGTVQRVKKTLEQIEAQYA